MLHTNFCGNLVIWFGRRRFLKGFYHIWRGGHLGHVTQMPKTNFYSPYTRRLHVKFGFDRPSDCREEDVCKGLTAAAGPLVYYKLTYEPLAQVS